MNIVIITQDEPFYMSENIEYLISILPAHSRIVGCVLSDASPFGKKESFFEKALKTYRIFGVRFFVYYSTKFLLKKLNKRKQIRKILEHHEIAEIKLKKSINSFESVELIKSYNPDILVSILGNEIFKKPIIELAPKGCLNLHTALLPNYRGLIPSFWVLLHDEKYTGVSVFFVDEGIDSGPIVEQKRILIGDMSQEELIKVTKRMGMEAIAKAVDNIEKGKVKLIKNDSSKKSYYSFPTKNDIKKFRAAGKRFF